MAFGGLPPLALAFCDALSADGEARPGVEPGGQAGSEEPNTERAEPERAMPSGVEGMPLLARQDASPRLWREELSSLSRLSRGLVAT